MAIFLSYARPDFAAAQALLKDLERTDHRPWMDGQLRGGDAWWNEILRQIRECTVFIFALSDHSMHSKPCQAELDYARRLGVPIIPLQVGPVSTMRAGPFADVQVIDYSRPNSTAAMELFAAIQRLSTNRGPLAHPDAEPPGVPFAYLMRLRNEIDSPTLTGEGQDRVLSELTRAFEQEEVAVRPDIVDLMRELRVRPDVTWRVANQLDRILTPVGATAGGGTGTTGSPQGPSPASASGARGDWSGSPPGGGPGTAVPPSPGAAPYIGPPGPRVPVAPGPPPPTAPQRGRRRTAWVFVAVGAVVVLAVAVVLGVLVLRKGPSSSTTGGSSTDRTVGPSSPDSASSPGPVTMHITDTLDASFETFEVVTVTSQGQQVGKLEVSQASPEASLDVTAQAGTASYELDVEFIDLAGNQGSCVGKGTVNASDGATFVVVSQAVGSGCAASLEPR